jgi:hypothetical protein
MPYGARPSTVRPHPTRSEPTPTTFSVGDGTQTVAEGLCGGTESISLVDTGIPTLDQVDANPWPD